ncbi:hypothetical protein [Bacillus cereus]|uniref:hypothetical protein n=1 Tax=Bacillus cereus TaxID=1396 RepID=UPI003749F9BC
MPNENSAISISPTDIKIDEAGRVIINDPVLAESLVRVRDLSPGGELSCNIGDCGVVNAGNCGGGGTINAGCGKLEDIGVSDAYRDVIISRDIRPLEDIRSIREHITRDDFRDGPAVDRPV